MDLNRLPNDHGGGGVVVAGVTIIIDSDTESESDVVVCSICLDPATKLCERTVVGLKCNHTFHLDCIGSAFNAKGDMECPNCRSLEIGDWKVGTGNVPPAINESDDEMPAQSYSPQVLTIQWSPNNDAPLHFNDENYFFANNYTHASVQWNGTFAPASPFSALQSPFYHGVQPGANAVVLSPSSQYLHNHVYSAPLVSPPAGTVAEALVPLSTNGFPLHINSPNMVSCFTSHPPYTLYQNFIGVGFSTPTESLLADSLNIQTPGAGAGQVQQEATWPNHP